MEIALIREIMAAFPDVENGNAKKLDDLMGLCDRFFRWERQHILLADPTDQEKKEHEEIVQFLQRVTKVLLLVDRNRRLETLSRRLNESWLIFHNPIQAGQAEKVLAQAFPK
jgi:hypothetical protein